MARAYSQDLRDRVIKAVEAGESARSSGRRFGVSEAAAIKWVRRWRDTGSPSPKQVGGYKPCILADHADWVLGLVSSTPDMTLREIRHHLQKRGVMVVSNTIWRFLQHNGLTYKKRQHMQQSKSERM